MYTNYLFRLLALMLILSACNNGAEHLSDAETGGIGPTDPDATAETVALFHNLKELSGDHILFAHQHATEYGHRWRGDDNKSDVKLVTGSHPAVIGVDFMWLSNRPREDIEEEKERLRKYIVEAYDRGAVITAGWHFHNPVSGDRFYYEEEESVAAVEHIIPGGKAHEDYKRILEDIADVAHSVVGSNGTLAPIIFRPYHEFDGDWFWWGKSWTDRDDFITLWQFTVTYLRDELGVNNFLYAFSPDNRYDTLEEYLERYPGDSYVDLVGMDNYADMGRDRYDLEAAIHKLKIVSDYAKDRGKIAAFTETGLETLLDTTWWTDTLLEVVKADGLELAYVLVWRNATNSDHYYAPFPGQVSVPNFMEFYEDPFTLFEEDLENIYSF